MRVSKFDKLLGIWTIKLAILAGTESLAASVIRVLSAAFLLSTMAL